MSDLDNVASQIEGAGIVLDGQLEFERLIRCKVSGPDKADVGGKTSGWYVLYTFTTKSGKQLIVGRFGNWKDASCPQGGWEVEIDKKGFSDEEKAEYKKQREAARRRAAEEKKARAKEAAERAAKIWDGLPDTGESKYLKRKGVMAYGLRFTRGTCVVPVRTAKGDLVGLQFIDADGGKKYLTGTAKAGAMHVLGEIGPESTIGIAEGYATGATAHKAMGWPVAVVFDAGNIGPSLKALRERYPKHKVVIFGDDDHETEGNPGRHKASLGASRYRARCVYPQFKRKAGKTDWNDLLIEQDIEAVKRQVMIQIEGGNMPPPDEYSGPDYDEREWELGLATTEKGAIKGTLFNLISILEHRSEWAGLFALDGFANQLMMTRKTPYDTKAGPLNDVDGTEVAAWLGDPANYGLAVKSGMTLEAVEVIATRQTYNPVVRYLDGLVWDGEDRLPTMLRDFFGTQHNDYAQAVGLNWLISAVARIRRPGCKVDTMTILEGPQGAGKSTAVRTLCGPEWFSEATESPQHKDFYQALTGRWVVEIAEMQSFNKADRNRIKQVLSAQEDTYRPSYGRYARQFPRQGIFVGTTNDHVYLKDETGARRFYPVKCMDINLEAIARLRDQFWAEADARFARGEHWWEFPASAAEEQDKRFDVDSWEEPIVKWLEGDADSKRYEEVKEGGGYYSNNQIKKTKTTDIMVHALGIDIAKHSIQDQGRVGRIMARLGWPRKQKRVNGKPQWEYHRPMDDDGGDG